MCVCVLCCVYVKYGKHSRCICDMIIWYIRYKRHLLMGEWLSFIHTFHQNKFRWYIFLNLQKCSDIWMVLIHAGYAIHNLNSMDTETKVARHHVSGIIQLPEHISLACSPHNSNMGLSAMSTETIDTKICSWHPSPCTLGSEQCSDR